jgi:UDP-N-acetylmuramoyl-L-alanyl-D-glutamate--2,6-diaminopimelate ligase
MTVRELLQGMLRELPTSQRPVIAADPALDVPCTGVIYDSRQAKRGSVFVALRGQRADGAAFAPQAVAGGAVAVLSERAAMPDVPAPWIVVPNARLALGHLAAEFFGHPSRRMKVVGITGTNGKRTTGSLMGSIFEAAGVQCGLMGTVTCRIGDTEMAATRTMPEAPEVQGLMRQMVDAGCGACIVEIASRALAMHRVDGIRFAAGIFTNLTCDHLDVHHDVESSFAAQRRLFEMLPVDSPAVFNLDDPRGASLIEIAGWPVTYAVNRDADVTPGPLTFGLEGLTFDVRMPQGTAHVKSRLVGRPNVYNILAATATAAWLGLRIREIEDGLAMSC